MRIVVRSLVVVVFLFLSLHGRAQELINIDFGAHLNPVFSVKRGPAAVGFGSEDYWNLYSRDGTNEFDWLANSSLTNLKTATGLATGANLSVSNAAGAWFTSSADPMFQSYLYPLGRTGDIRAELQNLPAGVYDIYVYAHGSPDSENAAVELASGNTTYGTKATSAAGGWEKPEWAEDKQYVVFRNVSVREDIPIVVLAKPGVSGLAVINGIQMLRRPSLEGPPAPSSSDIWDVNRGSVITRSSGDRAGFDPRDAFGGNFSTLEPAQFVFRDDRAEGFVHFLEWQTPAPVLLQSFRLFAAGDGPIYNNEREFARFTLKAKSSPASDYDVTLFNFIPAHPYTFQEVATSLLVAANVNPTLAQFFRAEFVQFNGQRGFDGPRIIELDGFSELTASVPLLWMFVSGSAIQSSPAIGQNGVIYFGSYDGHLYALNPGGTKRWQFPTAGLIFSSPALAPDGTIYVGSYDRKLYAINQDGSKKWEFATDGIIWSSPALAEDGTIYIGSGTPDNQLYALNPDGSVKWRLATDGVVNTSPAVAVDGTVYFGSFDHNLYALNPDGSTKWMSATPNAITSSPAIGSDGTIYAGNYDGKVYAFDPADGRVRWATTMSANPITGSAALALDGTIYLGSLEGKLYALDSDGSRKWDFDAGAALESTPLVASDGSVLFGADNGKLYALRPDGTKLWEYATAGSTMYGCPALSTDGWLYFGSSDRKLYALGTTFSLAQSAWPMFRRDAQHTGRAAFQGPRPGITRRELPANYAPGMKLTVSVQVTPTPGITSFALEEIPPVGWVVGQVSHGGEYDPDNQKVKFGPFSDSQPLILTYDVTPPAGEDGVKQFVGTVSADGAGVPVEGDVAVSRAQSLHPADLNPADNRLTIDEVTAYASAWRKGTDWPAPPTIIPIEYVTRAGTLWKRGETYRFDPSIPAAPLWWVNVTSVRPQNADASAGLTSLAGSAVRELPGALVFNAPFTVRVRVRPALGITVYAIEDQVPAGWSAANVSDGGVFDAVRGSVRFGPYFDAKERDLTYDVSPITTVHGAARFDGVVSFDGASAVISGEHHAMLSIPGGLFRRVADGQFELKLAGPPEARYAIRVSPNLRDWSTLTTVTDNDGRLIFTDPDATGTERFYWPALIPKQP